MSTSSTSFFTSLSNFFHTTEQEVLTIITDIITDAKVVENDIEKGLAWVVAQTPNIAAAVVQVEQMISAIASVTPGLAQNASVNKAIQEANAAVTALNAFATASNTGTQNPAALVQGYVAYQTAIAASSTAKAAVSSL